jgi:DNA-binding transcriptional regulator YdaS (Cro superfamily)
MTDEEILSGSFFVLPTKTIMRLGTFDERFGIGPYADLDYQFRLMMAAKKVMRVHNVCVHHFEGRTVTQIPGFFDELEEQNRKHFEQKWNPSVPLPPMKEDFEFEIWMRKVKMVPPPDPEEIRRRTHFEAAASREPARIVACINIFNDLTVLPDCLASLEAADEIVIVDGAYAAIEHDVPYSTDGTLEYLKDLAAEDRRIRVVECTKAWADEPTKRSAYFISSDRDWYLQIDADERLEAIRGDADPIAVLRDHLTSCLLDVHSLPRYDLETKTSRYFPRLFRHRDGIHYEAAHWNVVVESRTVAADWSAFMPVAGVRLVHLRHERPASRLNVQDTYYKQMLANEAAAFEQRAEEIERTLTGDARRDAEKLELMWTYVSAAAYQREYHETQ